MTKRRKYTVAKLYFRRFYATDVRSVGVLLTRFTHKRIPGLECRAVTSCNKQLASAIISDRHLNTLNYDGTYSGRKVSSVSSEQHTYHRILTRAYPIKFVRSYLLPNVDKLKNE